MKYVIDIDGFICHNGSHLDYAHAIPLLDNIDKVNRLVGAGHMVVLHTSRKEVDRQVTVAYLNRLGVQYHGLAMDKPTADVYIDDKAETVVPSYGAKLNRKKLVICYSGGMDSVIAYFWAQRQLGFDKDDILLLNFNIGNNYADKESVARENIGLPFETIEVPIVRADLGNMTDRDNYIVPGRNLVFASIAAAFGETVWIVGIKFEDHPFMYDKNSAFYRAATLACSQALGAFTKVESPFSNMTKTDMIRWAMEQGLDEYLSKTVSCYDDTKFRCGECGLCFKRAIAMEAAGRSEVSEYDVNPFTGKQADHYRKEYKVALRYGDFTHYERDRIEETLNIIGR